MKMLLKPSIEYLQKLDMHAVLTENNSLDRTPIIMMVHNLHKIHCPKIPRIRHYGIPIEITADIYRGNFGYTSFNHVSL